MNNQNRPSFLYRLQNFMYGRNGMDRFNIALIIVYAVFIILSLFIRSIVFTIIQLLLLAYIIFRFVSKNLYSRQRENTVYMQIEKNVKSFVAVSVNRVKERKTHVYRKCPSCKNYLRLPKKKGHHTVKCPCCRNRFDVNI